MTARGLMAAMLCAIVFTGTAAAQTNIGELLDIGVHILATCDST